MSMLLNLPRELRNLIYAKLFEPEDSRAPPSPAALQRQKTWLLFPFWLPNSSSIYAPPRTLSLSHGVLGSCRQIRDEVLHHLEREHQQRRVRYTLDCMALRNGELYSSWLWLPCPLRFLDTFEVNVRIIPADAEIEGARVLPPPDRFLNDPCFKLAELIEEFFTRGPSYRPVKVLRTDITVKGLIVNIIPPDSVSDDVLHDRRASASGRLPDGSVHPEKIFQSFSANHLLQRMLRGRMKELVIRYEGRVYRWNAADNEDLCGPRPRRMTTVHRIVKRTRQTGRNGRRNPR